MSKTGKITKKSPTLSKTLSRAVAKSNLPTPLPVKPKPIVCDNTDELLSLVSKVDSFEIHPLEDVALNPLVLEFLFTSYLFAPSGKILDYNSKQFYRLVMPPALIRSTMEYSAYKHCGKEPHCVEDYHIAHGRYHAEEVDSKIPFELYYYTQPAFQYGMFAPQYGTLADPMWNMTIDGPHAFLKGLVVHPSIFRFCQMCDPEVYGTKPTVPSVGAAVYLRSGDYNHPEFRPYPSVVQMADGQWKSVTDFRSRPFDCETPPKFYYPCNSVCVEWGPSRPIVACASPVDGLIELKRDSCGKYSMQPDCPYIVHPVIDFFLTNPIGVYEHLGNFVPMKVGTTRQLHMPLDQRFFICTPDAPISVDGQHGRMYVPSPVAKQLILQNKVAYLTLVRHSLAWSYYVNFHVECKVYVNGVASIMHAIRNLTDVSPTVFQHVVGVPLAHCTGYEWVMLDESCFSGDFSD